MHPVGTSERLLVLFDIDATLLGPGGALAHRRARLEAVEAVTGLRPPADAFERVRAWGKTDRRVAREIVAALGLSSIHADRVLPDVERRMVELHDRYSGADMVRAVLPGVREALRAMREHGHLTALLTGNLEPIARRKMRMAGLAQHFGGGWGAFGSDAEDRSDLVQLACARAGTRGAPWPAYRAVVVGDTPRDLACARAGGAASMAVATGAYDAASLSDADLVIDAMSDLPTGMMTLFGSSWHAGSPRRFRADSMGPRAPDAA